MVSQLYPINFPFSVLDFGLTALALLVIGVMTYFFIRYLNRERDTRETYFKVQVEGLTRTMEQIVNAAKSVAEQADRHTEVSRGMMNEFYHMAEELRELREEFYAARKGYAEVLESLSDIRARGTVERGVAKEVHDKAQASLDTAEKDHLEQLRRESHKG